MMHIAASVAQWASRMCDSCVTIVRHRRDPRALLLGLFVTHPARSVARKRYLDALCFVQPVVRSALPPPLRCFSGMEGS